MHSDNTDEIIAKTQAFDYLPEQVSDKTKTAEHLRWISLSELKVEDMTLPIDKVAIQLLLEKRKF